MRQAAGERRRGRGDGVTIGVDIGGTFTDLVLLAGRGQPPVTLKVLTTPRDET